MKLHSDIHKEASTLIVARDALMNENVDRIVRNKTLRRFVNLLPTLTEEEKRSKEVSEDINFGLTYSAALENLTPLESMVVGTNSLCEITLDYENPSKDPLASTALSRIINKWIFTGNSKILDLWTVLVGEGYICGGGPAIFKDKGKGLFPEYGMNLFFPAKCPLDANRVSYAFEYKEYSLKDLEDIHALMEDDDKLADRKAVGEIIKKVKEAIQGRGAISTQGSSGTMNASSVRDESKSSAIVEAWVYYESRLRKDFKKDDQKSPRYISKIIFIDGISGIESKNIESNPLIIEQTEVAFDRPSDWLTFFVFDEEVGGGKTTSSLKGIAELIFPAAAMIEKLNNVSLEGAIRNSLLCLQTNSEANPEEVKKFNPLTDSVIPNGTSFAEIPNGSNSIGPFVTNLAMNISSISGSSYSNTGRGQALRVQELNRQESASQIQSNKVTKAYAKLDILLDLIVGRALLLDPNPKDPDYELIAGFQQEVIEEIEKIYEIESQIRSKKNDSAENLPREDEEDEDYGNLEMEGVSSGFNAKNNRFRKEALEQCKKLMKRFGQRRHGKFCFLSVRAKRDAVGLNRVNEKEVVDTIVKMVETGQVPPEISPMLMMRALAYLTQDNDLAKLVFQPPNILGDDQRTIAQNEWSTIKNRAVLGEPLQIGQRDVDEYHAESHLTDLAADVARNNVKPWTKAELNEYQMGSEHLMLHLSRMSQKRQSAEPAKKLYIGLQGLTGEAMSIAARLEEEQEQTPGNLDDQLKMVKIQQIQTNMQMAGRKFGMQASQNQSLEQQRQERSLQGREKANVQKNAAALNAMNQKRQTDLKEEELRLKQGEFLQNSQQHKKEEEEESSSTSMEVLADEFPAPPGVPIEKAVQNL